MAFDFAVPANAQLLYQERETRYIIARTLIHGRLELQAPTLISNGASDLPTDMALLRDLVEARALIPGSSIAGALRAYLKNFADERALFGDRLDSDDSTGDQSALLVSDAISTTIVLSMVRDGVQIDGTTRTASDGAKYDLELLPAGTCFDLYFELLHEVPFDQQAKFPKWQESTEYNQKRLKLLAQALYGLEAGQIALGMRKQRGLGLCQVTNWQIWHYRLTEPDQMLQWLLFDREQPPVPSYAGPNIGEGLGLKLDRLPPSQCQIQVEFGLEQSLLIRSARSNPYAPDDTYLETRLADGSRYPVIPGTSWAGIMRHRAAKILATLKNQAQQPTAPDDLIKELFGYVATDDQARNSKAQMSRVRIHDSLIKQASTDYIQTRIAVDRFTGGPYPSALLAEQPVWGLQETQITLDLTINKATDHDIGLLLLVIKDLWLGDLTVGGEQSIGRGVLAGRSFKLWIGNEAYHFHQVEGQLTIDSPSADRLQMYVDVLRGV
ncbi:RAMP superfamily CRISPR-associated protein [Herpetosiphon giganteus]|uniref:RAMP superfamily CRISPR-associated protein n=1 Tax=Herpetosiphon giganteus TaxID=2029754 RepID=UPI00195A2CE1|nr:RAMP superfamily CRISPR-associated protein [Herpetosiphon giganteus]MBM7844806.1 CRISPR/Cas system CSM-associated protein Csm3 (group 7 of RAMP superfamily) [Herpetosiphon giganteus]